MILFTGKESNFFVPFVVC